MSGYVRLYRTLFGHPAFRNDAEAMAFAWLVAKAAWRPCRVRYKERAVSLRRGQVAVSVRDFAAAMDRDKAWIERLLKRLKAETMVEVAHETGVNVITICNYSQYQDAQDRGKTPNETQDKTDARQGQDTEQRREEVKELSSVSNDTGAADPLKDLFDIGVSVLKSAGNTEKQARSLIGKWRKAKTDAEVLQGLLDCRARAISEPVEWLEKRFKSARYVSPSGYEYRGTDREILKEAERRGDNGTYWAVKSAMKASAA